MILALLLVANSGVSIAHCPASSILLQPGGTLTIDYGRPSYRVYCQTILSRTSASEAIVMECSKIDVCGSGWFCSSYFALNYYTIDKYPHGATASTTGSSLIVSYDLYNNNFGTGLKCTFTAKPINTPATTAAPATAAPTQSPGSCNCGVRSSSRIIGGQDASSNSHPWAVRLRSGNSVCGGTVLDENTILTAAHCIKEGLSLSQYTVTAGEHNFYQNEACDQVRGVSQIINHEHWNGNAAYGNDIALIKLSSPLQFGSCVQPACIPNTADMFEGETATSVGWGDTIASASSSLLGNPLQEVQLPIITQNSCKTYWGGNIMDKVMCTNTTSGNESPCGGDSGGPLTVQKGGRAFVVGIVSYGPPEPASCGDKAAVYTRVSSFLNWIQLIEPSLCSRTV